MTSVAPLVAEPVRDEGVVRAAGALLWRERPGSDGSPELQVALVHRPKYDDWSWPKGKLDPGESWAAAAVREVLEETGLHVRLGIPLPHATYEVGGNGSTRPKVVHYWAAHVLADGGELADEVDEVVWTTFAEARSRLDYRRDRLQLKALRAAARESRLDTWPLLVVRHASSVGRRRWKDDDARRPLDDAGHARAADLVPVLSAYGVTRVVTSDAERCAATVAPFARAAGVRLIGRHSLSEEGFADDPARAVATLGKVLSRGEPAAVCTHRPLLPAVLGHLAEHAPHPDVAAALRESAGPGLVKGEVLVAHVAGVGDGASVVAVERHGV
ncbi:NUDIX hydrolase [Angustibacter peucedani]